MSTKLRNIEYNELEYAKLVNKIIAMTGMATAMEDFEIGLAINFFKKHYKPRPHPSNPKITIYSPEYIAKIWEYGIAGYFPMPEPYRLSLGYIGNVMANFKEWRRKENIKPPVAKPEFLPLPPKAEIESDKAICQKEFERFKRTGNTLFAGQTYDSLVSLGRLGANDYQAYMRLAELMEKSDREEKGKASGSVSTLRSLLNSITTATVKNRAKCITVTEYFKTINSLQL